jgi:WD40 repeat protein
MLTSSTDNSLKMWIFDQSDHTGRLLRERSGHSAPPTRVRFYGMENSHHVLSSGSDRSLRLFNTIQDHQSVQLSQGHIRSKAKKLKRSEESLMFPPITSFSSHPIREREWDNILTCHAGSSVAHTWSFQRKAIGKHSLQSKKDEGGVVWSCCHVSPCGNFGVLGSFDGPFLSFFPSLPTVVFFSFCFIFFYYCLSIGILSRLYAGTIEVFNLQSGLYRGGFMDASVGRAHAKAVTGLTDDRIIEQKSESLRLWWR